MKKNISTSALAISLLMCLLSSYAFAQNAEVEDIEVITEEVQTVTFLGIETSRISKALRNHIDLPEGIGLTVSHIAEDSGAAQADLQQYDILHKVDDQIIVNQEQLRTYIRSKEPGDSVRLEILRKGKTLKVPVKLSERDVPKQRHFGDHWPFPNPMPTPFENNGGNWDFNFDSEEFRERIEEFSQRAAEIGNRAMQFIPEIMIEHEEEDGSKRITTVGKGPNRIVLRKNNFVAEMINEKGDISYIIKESHDDEETILYEGAEPTQSDLAKLPDEAAELFERLKKSPEFDMKNMDKLIHDNIRVIINTGEDEANLSEKSGEGEEA